MAGWRERGMNLGEGEGSEAVKDTWKARDKGCGRGVRGANGRQVRDIWKGGKYTVRARVYTEWVVKMSGRVWREGEFWVWSEEWSYNTQIWHDREWMRVLV